MARSSTWRMARSSPRAGYRLKTGITRTAEFERKGLATHAVNVGVKCGHGCAYCSSPSLLRCHPSFKKVRESPFGSGYCILDPDTPTRIAGNVHKLRADHMVMLCSTSDAWSPEAQLLGLGEKCLEVILKGSPAGIRVLTKNASVIGAYDLVEPYRDRVRIGLSVTAPKSCEAVARALEPNASSISERLNALQEAHRRGLRTYGMLCPCLPGIAAGPVALEEIFDAVLSCGAEDIWLEPVNPRGNGLVRCVQSLTAAGFNAAAQAIDAVRNRTRWNEYALRLVQTAQQIAEKKAVLDRLHVLLYSSSLTSESMAILKADPRGIIWL